LPTTASKELHDMAVVKKVVRTSLGLAGVAALLVLGGVLFNGTVSAFSSTAGGDPTVANANRLVSQRRDGFRNDTFGDEAVWGGVLGLQKAIEGSKFGGVGAGSSPKQALELGLKVDAAAIPPKGAAAVTAGKVHLNDPPGAP